MRHTTEDGYPVLKFRTRIGRLFRTLAYAEGAEINAGELARTVGTIALHSMIADLRRILRATQTGIAYRMEKTPDGSVRGFYRLEFFVSGEKAKEAELAKIAYAVRLMREEEISRRGFPVNSEG